MKAGVLKGSFHVHRWGDNILREKSASHLQPTSYVVLGIATVSLEQLPGMPSFQDCSKWIANLYIVWINLWLYPLMDSHISTPSAITQWYEIVFFLFQGKNHIIQRDGEKDLVSPICILFICATCKNFACIFQHSCAFLNLFIHVPPLYIEVFAILLSTKTLSSVKASSTNIARPSICIKSWKLKLDSLPGTQYIIRSRSKYPHIVIANLQISCCYLLLTSTTTLKELL